MKKLLTLIITSALLFGVACAPKAPEPLQVIEKEVEVPAELPLYELYSLEKAGFEFEIPDDEIFRDPYLENISAVSDVTADYYRTITDYPLENKGYSLEAEKGQYTALYANIGGDVDVTYFPVGIFTCCKTSDLEANSYFLINGNYLTKDYAEQFLVDTYYKGNEDVRWAVYDFTEIFTDGDFDTAVDKLYTENNFAEPNNGWLKSFRKSMLENRHRYIFKNSWNSVWKDKISPNQWQPFLYFEPMEKEKAEKNVSEIFLWDISEHTTLWASDSFDESKITYTLDDPDHIINTYKLEKFLEIMPDDFGTARITFEYEGKYQIADITVGDEDMRAKAAEKRKSATAVFPANE